MRLMHKINVIFSWTDQWLFNNFWFNYCYNSPKLKLKTIYHKNIYFVPNNPTRFYDKTCLFSRGKIKANRTSCRPIFSIGPALHRLKWVNQNFFLRLRSNKITKVKFDYAFLFQRTKSALQQFSPFSWTMLSVELPYNTKKLKNTKVKLFWTFSSLVSPRLCIGYLSTKMITV